MQTTSLPIQAAPGSPTQTLRANVSPPNDGVNFSAMLKQQSDQRLSEQRQVDQRQVDQRQVDQRQLDQRQAAQPQPQPNLAPPQQAMAGPKPQAAAKPAANESRAPAREVAREAAKETARTNGAGKPDAANASAVQEQAAAPEDAAAEAATAADAKAADAVVDMLALVASFNQTQQAALAVPAPALPAAPSVQPGVLADALQGKAGDGAALAAQSDGDALLASMAEQAHAKTEPGIDPRALEAGKAGDTGKFAVDTGDFASRLRDTVAQAAAAASTPAAPSAEALTSLANQATALQNAQAAGGVPTDRLSARVGTPAWDNQVGQKVIWMLGGEDQSATLELNPPDLGPVQVVLNVSNDMASVTFSSQQLEVRQALENALPRLREMMNDSGVALGNATVNAGAEGRQGQDGNGSGRPGGRNGNGGGADGSGDSAMADAAPRQRTGFIGGAGAVDTFA